MIVVSGEDIAHVVRSHGSVCRRFSIHDGDVFNGLLGQAVTGEAALGEIALQHRASALDPTLRAEGAPIVAVTVAPVGAQDSSIAPRAIVDGMMYGVSGSVLSAAGWATQQVQVVPIREDLFSRSRGLIETDTLAGKCVFLKGIGSLGSTIYRLLVQSGIGRFVLMDPDRVEICNVVRQETGLSDVGRFKTRAMADSGRNKNPYVEVVTHEDRLCPENLEEVEEIVRQSDVIIDTGDERQGKLLLNKKCVQLQATYIVAGAFHRAYGGQVIRVRPGETGCYQCFLNSLHREFTIGGGEPAPQQAAYSNRPGPIEPGLSVDIMPIAHLVAKLALQELLRDQATTLRSLDEDLTASRYLWLNRREAGTQYAELAPLGIHVDGVHILRWYGFALPRDPYCPVCGDADTYLEHMRRVGITDSEVAMFEKMRERGGT